MNFLRQFAQNLELKTTGKWMLLSLLTGCVAGLGAISFQYVNHLVEFYTLGRVAGYLPPETAGERSMALPAATFSPGLLLVVMTMGGLASGLLVYRFAPEAEGHGTDAVIDAFHNKRGRIRPVVPFVKAIASALTLGTGGSAGARDRSRKSVPESAPSSGLG